MKTTLISLSQDKFILVNDEAIKEGDWYYTEPYSNLSIRKCEDDKYDFTHCKKIIAGIPELPKTELSDLKEEDCKTIGWVDMKKLANIKWGNVSRSGELGFIQGFKAAQSLLNDKMFSLEDIRKSFYRCFENRSLGYSVTMGDLEIELSKSLQQSWQVEVEMERNHFDNEGQVTVWYTPKITNNSIKVIKIL